MLSVRELSAEPDVAAAFPLMAQLRTHLRPEGFVALVRRQQESGYRLFGGLDAARLVVLAGAREAHTLSRGAHLFVDDLVTLDSERDKGHGAAMVRWLLDHARARELPRLYLDSRDTAIGFYQRLGFEMLTSVPCWVRTSSPAP